MADTTINGAPADARSQLAFYAAGEIEAIGRMLRIQQHEDGFGLVLNGALIRISDLSSVLLSLHGGDGGRDWAEVHQLVFGQELRESQG